MTIKIILSVLSFVIVLISGIWMSKLGKPYQVVLFNIHKFISLAAIALTVVVINDFNKVTGLTSQQFFLVVIVAVFLLATLVSGGILSAKEEAAKIFFIIHRIMPAFIVIGLTALLIILKKGS